MAFARFSCSSQPALDGFVLRRVRWRVHRIIGTPGSGRKAPGEQVSAFADRRVSCAARR
jgi:hypothetical protein